MMHYKDMTFCPASIYKQCAKASDCDRPLTEKVIAEAEQWWGAEEGGPPIAQFAEQPECFEEKKDE